MTRPQLYILLAMIGAIILSTGAFMLLRSSPTATSETWTTAGGFLPWSEQAPLKEEPEIRYEGSGMDSIAVPLPPPPTSEGTADAFDDLATLLGQLVQPQTPRTDSDPATPSSYAFIPQGFTTFPTERPRTADQQALHEYGNSLGLSLRSFADLHPDMPQTLRDQAEDRSNASKGEAVRRLGDSFIRLGDDIGAMDSVPASASAAHTALAAAYRDAGAKLAMIPDASSDQAFLDAVNAYNATAENLSKRLVAMIDLFVIREVTFSETDPGSVFTFSANASF